MRRIFLAITVLYFLQLAYGQEVCHVGSSHRQTVRTNCRHGGCAVVSYKNTGGQGIAEYKCLTDINHPAFVTLACEHSTVDATCFDQYSNKELPINIRRLQVRERTFGELLRELQIERFCCCRGSYCNAANQQIQQHFGLNQPQQVRVWEDDFPRRSEHPEDDFPRHGHRHNHEPSSATFSVISLSALLISALSLL